MLLKGPDPQDNFYNVDNEQLCVLEKFNEYVNHSKAWRKSKSGTQLF